MSLPPHTYPPGWCFHHERIHDPADWGDLCQAYRGAGGMWPAGGVFTAEQYGKFQNAWQLAELDQHRRRGWWKRWSVCWWKHRTRQVAGGTYRTRDCWACHDG